MTRFKECLQSRLIAAPCQDTAVQAFSNTVSRKVMVKQMFLPKRKAGKEGLKMTGVVHAPGESQPQGCPEQHTDKGTGRRKRCAWGADTGGRTHTVQTKKSRFTVQSLKFCSYEKSPKSKQQKPSHPAHEMLGQLLLTSPHSRAGGSYMLIGFAAEGKILWFPKVERKLADGDHMRLLSAVDSVPL